MVCVGNWQIQFIFIQRNQYRARILMYASRHLCARYVHGYNVARNLWRLALIHLAIYIHKYTSNFVCRNSHFWVMYFAAIPANSFWLVELNILFNSLIYFLQFDNIFYFVWHLDKFGQIDNPLFTFSQVIFKYHHWIESIKLHNKKSNIRSNIPHKKR